MSRTYMVTFIIEKVDDMFDQVAVEDAIVDDGFGAVASVLSIPFPTSDSFKIVDIHEIDEEN